MKKLLFAIAIFTVVLVGWEQAYQGVGFLGTSTSITDDVAVAFREHASGIQVTGQGVVTRILSDDNEGRRHQRFILTLSSGQTLLIAHNIDIAPRINALKSGDIVEFNGVYEWNEKGGVVHWTHRDPDYRHQAGWLKHCGSVFQQARYASVS